MDPPGTPRVAIDELPGEIRAMILDSLRLSSLAACRGVCRAWKAEVDAHTHKVVAYLGASPRSPWRWPNQTTICNVLGITAEFAKTFPHSKELEYGHFGPYYEHIFNPDIVVALLVKERGWLGIRHLLNVKYDRILKREQLPARREEACRKRKRAFDAWLARESPLGEGIACLDDWMRFAPGVPFAISRNKTLDRFLVNNAVSGPSLAATKRATFELHAKFQAKAAKTASAA